MLKLTAALLALGNVAQAVTETLVTPAPDFTHGKVGSVASIVTFALSSF